MKVITIGSAMLDIFIQYGAQHMELKADEHQRFILLEEGRKIEVDDLDYYTGGGATNSAMSFVRIGFDARPLCKIGDDTEGEFIVSRLAQSTIHTELMVKTKDAKTGRSFIIPSPSGNYALLVYRGANELLSSADIPSEGADVWYITSLSGNAAAVLPALVQRVSGALVAANPGSHQLTTKISSLVAALPFLDILILNCYESHVLLNALLKTATQPVSFEQRTHDELPKLLCEPITPTRVRFSLVHYCKEVLARGLRIVVVTNGAEGVYVCDGTYIYFHPSIPTKIVSTIGAGDAFGSTFTALIAQGHPIEHAIRGGIINSAAVLSCLDTTSGLLDGQILNQRIHELDQSLLQRFSM